jgi:hypothetical protein
VFPRLYTGVSRRSTPSSYVLRRIIQGEPLFSRRESYSELFVYGDMSILYPYV